MVSTLNTVSKPIITQAAIPFNASKAVSSSPQINQTDTLNSLHQVNANNLELKYNLNELKELRVSV